MEKWKRIRTWITSAVLLLMAAVLIANCITIYQSGDRPFTRQAVGQALWQVAPLAIILVLLMIAESAQPVCDKLKAARDLNLQLSRFSSDAPEIRKERKLRKNYRLVKILTVACLAVYPVVYLLDVSHFSVTDVNRDILKAALVVLIPTAIVLTVAGLLQNAELASIQRELQYYKDQGIKPGAVCSKKIAAGHLSAVRVIVLLAAICLITVGAINGGAADVLGKAIRICTECIGLG